MAKNAGHFGKYAVMACVAFGFCALAPPVPVNAVQTTDFTVSTGFEVPDLNDSVTGPSEPEVVTQNAGVTSSMINSIATSDIPEQTDIQALEDAADIENNVICGYTNLGIADVKEALNIRKGAGTEYDLAGELPDGAGCEILKKKGEWYKIKSGKVTGWVNAKGLLTGEEAAKRAEKIKTVKATATTNGVNLRVKPNIDCDVQNTLDNGESAKVVEDLGEWIKVKSDGDVNYVSAEFVDVTETLPAAKSIKEIEAEKEKEREAEERRQRAEDARRQNTVNKQTSVSKETYKAKVSKNVSQTRKSLVNYALQFVGNPYVWGGTSLTHGVDCSGFTMKVYAKYGISLPHHAASQAGYGKSVSTSQIRPGDLIFYGSGGISHVAIYIGNGRVVHASNPSTGIKTSVYNYRTPVKIVSLLK